MMAWVFAILGTCGAALMVWLMVLVIRDKDPRMNGEGALAWVCTMTLCIVFAWAGWSFIFR